MTQIKTRALQNSPLTKVNQFTIRVIFVSNMCVYDGLDNLYLCVDACCIKSNQLARTTSPIIRPTPVALSQSCLPPPSTPLSIPGE